MITKYMDEAYEEIKTQESSKIDIIKPDSRPHSADSKGTVSESQSNADHQNSKNSDHKS